ncbi:MAG: hypothetical protein IT306_30780 [Chloroflexi bacterium]|nr:hypothetical protein [Chloroflexota bacterium]
MAADLFNRVWSLLGQADRTQADDDTMLHAAHASRFHWGEVGTPVNFARGEWQISRVYATLKRPEPALWHARRCLELCQQNGIGDFDLAFAYEAMARAHATAGQHEATNSYLQLARQAGRQIARQEDRDVFLADLASIPTGSEG